LIRHCVDVICNGLTWTLNDLVLLAQISLNNLRQTAHTDIAMPLLKCNSEIESFDVAQRQRSGIASDKLLHQLHSSINVHI